MSGGEQRPTLAPGKHTKARTWRQRRMTGETCALREWFTSADLSTPPEDASVPQSSKIPLCHLYRLPRKNVTRFPRTCASRCYTRVGSRTDSFCLFAYAPPGSVAGPNVPHQTACSTAHRHLDVVRMLQCAYVACLSSIAWVALDIRSRSFSRVATGPSDVYAWYHNKKFSSLTLTWSCFNG